ncbi:glycoside hydrolase family 6 protein [soil metagenome]
MQRHRGGGLFVLVAVLALAGVVALVLFLTGIRFPIGSSNNPFDGRDLYVYPSSSAALAAAGATGGSDESAFTTLASTPTAVWLLPEAHPTASVAAFVSGIEDDATRKRQLPVFVVYGIPSRDCGNFSAGGAATQDYPEWVAAIADGIGGRSTIVILEPDALALAPPCGTVDATTTFIRAAIVTLKAPATAIYLDGGHSTWLPPATMAPLLEQAGVDQVRGFATNVSNYNATDKEQAYGEQLSRLLGGTHYVIDTGRNGNGASGEWCNPSGRRIGDTPSGVVDAGHEDANLWVKNPGESDGTCNGGPVAGQWWPERAAQLVRGAT